MKKSVGIVLILMSCLLIGYTLLNNKKPEEIKKPEVTTQSRPTKDYSKVQLDLSGIMAVYEEEQYYGNRLVKHTVRIINGYGDTKNIDLTDVHLRIEPYKDEYLQKCMRDENIGVVKNKGKVSDEILNKIKKITDIELTCNSLPRDRVTNNIEDTNYYYYCACGDGSGHLKLINGYAPLKDKSYSSDNQDLKDVIKYLFTKSMWLQ